MYLGFDESANPTEKEIQEAYKKVAKVFHPDGGGSNEQFRGLTIARDILLQEAPVKKKKKEQPMPQQNYYNEREHINRLNTQILEELGEVLHKLPERVFYIFFKLHGAKASVKVHKRTLLTLNLKAL